MVETAPDAEGGGSPEGELFGLLYRELRRIAREMIRRHDPRSSLDPTELIGELYTRFAQRRADGWRDKDHFLATAAVAMRHVVIDHVRARAAAKRGGGLARAPASALEVLAARLDRETGGLLRFDDVLSRLRKEYPQAAEVVDLRFFGGLKVREVARVLARSVREIEREWTFARAWLQVELG